MPGPYKSWLGRLRRRLAGGWGLVWQRSYWERVVRSGDELDQIRAYIEDNPLRWRVDHWESRH